MSSFLGFGGGNKDQSEAARGVDPMVEQIKQSISAELNTAYAQALVNGLTENCFEKCIIVPSSTMTSVEKQCIDDCASKFMASWNLISKSYIQRINQK